jgi:hypothetical protein
MENFPTFENFLNEEHSALGDIFNFQSDDIRNAAMHLEDVLKKKGFNLLKNPEVLDAIKDLVLTAKHSKG